MSIDSGTLCDKVVITIKADSTGGHGEVPEHLSVAGLMLLNWRRYWLLSCWLRFVVMFLPFVFKFVAGIGAT